jgi:hypothetical protein
VCWNRSCVPVDVRTTDLGPSPTVVRADTSADEAPFGLRLARPTDRELEVEFWLKTPGTDGDVYALQFSEPGGEWSLDRSMSVTYDPVRSEGSCPEPAHLSDCSRITLAHLDAMVLKIQGPGVAQSASGG